MQSIMTPGRSALSRAVRSMSAAGLLLGATAVGLAAGPDRSPTSSQHQQDRSACDHVQPHQDRAACLREAAAAAAEARRGGPDPSAAQHHQRNALTRCDALPADQRQDCVARMQGQGTARGSVAEGGIYRETVTREPAGGAMR